MIEVQSTGSEQSDSDLKLENWLGQNLGGRLCIGKGCHPSKASDLPRQQIIGHNLPTALAPWNAEFFVSEGNWKNRRMLASSPPSHRLENNCNSTPIIFHQDQWSASYDFLITKTKESST
jgi:hypothetical protein